MKQRAEKILNVVCVVLIVLCSLFLLHYARRVFICDRFIIKGESMEPTLHGGRAVWVNKLIFGPRIYTDFDFSGGDMHCFRLPGLRKLEVGDYVIYNYPYGMTRERISFKLNYVYAKRCAACPGDTLRIVSSSYRNSRTGGIGVPESSEVRLAAMPDSLLLEMKCLRTGQFAGMQDSWTVKDFGPVAVPGRGMRVRLDPAALRMYSKLIEYETGRPAEEYAGQDYAFLKDYYFFVGDNVVNSRDSRYDGFVPEDFIVGVFKCRRK
jgi:signal peptidase I